MLPPDMSLGPYSLLLDTFEALKGRNTLDKLNSSCFLIHQQPQFLPENLLEDRVLKSSKMFQVVRLHDSFFFFFFPKLIQRI